MLFVANSFRLKPIAMNTSHSRKSDDFISPREAAEQLGMSIGTVKDMAQNGHLDAWKTSGGHWRISQRSVRAWLAARASVTPVFPNGKVDKSDAYLSSRQAATRLGVSIGTVQNMVDSGRLVAWKTVGQHRRVSLRSVEAYLASRPEPHATRSSSGTGDSAIPALSAVPGGISRHEHNRQTFSTDDPARTGRGQASGQPGGVQVGHPAPDFSAPAVWGNNELGTFNLAAQRGQAVLLVFYPLDFSLAGAAELRALAARQAEFACHQVTLAAISIDSHFTHLAWKNTPVDKGGIGQVDYPLLTDVKRETIRTYGVESAEGTALHACFLIDADGVIQYQQVYGLPLSAPPASPHALPDVTADSFGLFDMLLARLAARPAAPSMSGGSSRALSTDTTNGLAGGNSLAA